MDAEEDKDEEEHDTEEEVKQEVTAATVDINDKDREKDYNDRIIQR